MREASVSHRAASRPSGRAFVLAGLLALATGCQSMIGSNAPGFDIRFVNGETGEPVPEVAVLVMVSCQAWMGGGHPCFATSHRSDEEGRVKVPPRYVPPSAVPRGHSLSREAIFAFKAGGWSLGMIIHRIWGAERWFPHDRVSGPANSLVVKLLPIPKSDRKRRWQEYYELSLYGVDSIPKATWADYYNERRREAEILDGGKR